MTFHQLVGASGARFMLRRKGASTVAILTMAMALAANTVVLAILKAFVLSSFGVPRSDRLFVIGPTAPRAAQQLALVADAYPNYQAIRRLQRSFSDVAAAFAVNVQWESNGDAEVIQAARVTASLFSTTQVGAQLGQVFDVTAEGTSPRPVAVVSDGFWRSRMGGDSSAVGKTITLDGVAHTVVGVLPKGFALPARTDVWLPMSLTPAQMNVIVGNRLLITYGRLRDDVTEEQAGADARRFSAMIAAMDTDNKDFEYALQTIQQVLVPGAARTLLFVEAGAALLLCLAALNLASVLVAWGFDRRQEMAIRLAIGASARRIAFLNVAQAGVVVLLAAVVATGLTLVTVGLLRGLDLAPSLALFMGYLELDASVLLLGIAIACAVAIGAGVLASVLARIPELSEALRAGSRNATLSPRAVRWQKGVIVLQAGVSVLILFAAGLMGISFLKLSRVPAGFTANSLVVAHVRLPAAEYPDPATQTGFRERLSANMKAEGDLAAFEFTSSIPIGDGASLGRFKALRPDGTFPEQPTVYYYRRISPSYFKLMEIPMKQGRAFEQADDMNHQPVAIISQSLARKLWPKGDALGKSITRAFPNGLPPDVTVVGVAGDVMDGGFGAAAGQTIYVPYDQAPTPQMTIVFKSRGQEAAAIRAVRHAVHNTDPRLPVTGISNMPELLNQSNGLPQLQSFLLLGFAGIAIGIVLLGSYGVMNQLVANRERELAIRLIFGAERSAVGRAVFTQLLRLSLPGVAAGIVAVVGLSEWMRPFVFGIGPRSPGLMAATGLCVLALGLLASIGPSARAMRIDIHSWRAS